MTLGQSVRSALVLASSVFVVGRFVGASLFVIVGKLGWKARLCWSLQAIDSQQLVFAAAWHCCSRAAAADARPPIAAYFAVSPFEFSFALLN